MKNRANLVAALSFVVGLSGFVSYARQVRAEAQGGALQEVLIVTADLSAGSLITQDLLGVVQIPRDYVDARRVPASQRKDILGGKLTVELHAGESVVWSDVQDGSAKRNLAELVLPGRRAYRLDAAANSLGSLLRVEDHVDVLLERAGKTEVLLQDVLVLAVGNALEEESRERADANTGVTLSVTPEQSTLLLSGERRGDLRLVLRNPEDAIAREETSQEPKLVRVKVERGSTQREIEHVR